MPLQVWVHGDVPVHVPALRHGAYARYANVRLNKVETVTAVTVTILGCPSARISILPLQAYVGTKQSFFANPELIIQLRLHTTDIPSPFALFAIAPRAIVAATERGYIR